MDTARCLRPLGNGERIKPLPASFARANESATQASDISFAYAEELTRDFRDAKAMAQTLREALKAKSIPITHGESLELVARILGFHDWNVLSATIKSTPSDQQPTVIERADPPPITAGAKLPTLPLRDIVLFPKMIVPLFVGRQISMRAVERAMAFDRCVLAVTQRRSADDNPSLQDLYRVGVAASVIEQTTFEDGTIRLLLKGLERATITQLAEGQFLTAEIAPVEDSRGQDADAFELSRTVLEEFRACNNVTPSDRSYAKLSHLRQPGELADAIAGFLAVKIDRRQDLLETSDVIARLEKIRSLMKTDWQAA